MKRIVFLLSTVTLFSFLLIACASHQLQSGLYTMTINLPGKTEPMSKPVIVNVQNNKITITSDEDQGGLQGTIKGDELVMTSQAKNDQLEFKGKLVANNRVEGKAVQTKEDTTLEATFSLVESSR